jgi:hypothetical protein
MIVSHSRQFVFIKTKKTAGTSIELFLSPLLSKEDIVTPVSPEDTTEEHRPRNFQGSFWPVPEAAGLVGAPAEWKRIDGGGAIRSLGHALKGKRYYNHISAYRVAHRLTWPIWKHYLTVAVERNPWDKAISQFYWKARRRENYTFRDFVAEGDVGVNWPRYCDPRSGEILVDRVLYYHRLNQELDSLFGELGIPFAGSLNVRAKGKTRTDRKPYQELFTGELAPYRSEVERLFAHEISLHGWDFDSGLPHAAVPRESDGGAG